MNPNLSTTHPQLLSYGTESNLILVDPPTYIDCNPSRPAVRCSLVWNKGLLKTRTRCRGQAPCRQLSSREGGCSG